MFWKVIFIFLLVMFSLVLFFNNFYFSRNNERSETISSNIGNNMIIKSPDFKNNQRIPSRFTCDGKDINPTLVFEDIPKNSKSLVLIVDDPDAPMGTWVHWTLWNIPKDTKIIEENSKPKGAIEGITSFGKPGYGGPCPPNGVHRYFF